MLCARLRGFSGILKFGFVFTFYFVIGFGCSVRFGSSLSEVVVFLLLLIMRSILSQVCVCVRVYVLFEAEARATYSISYSFHLPLHPRLRGAVGSI